MSEETPMTTDHAKTIPTPPGRVLCRCGVVVLAENWTNHLSTQARGPHGLAEGPDDTGLTAEERALLERLDELEAHPGRLLTQRGEALQTRLENRLTQLAQGGPESVAP